MQALQKEQIYDQYKKAVEQFKERDQHPKNKRQVKNVKPQIPREKEKKELIN